MRSSLSHRVVRDHQRERRWPLATHATHITTTDKSNPPKQHAHGSCLRLRGRCAQFHVNWSPHTHGPQNSVTSVTHRPAHDVRDTHELLVVDQTDNLRTISKNAMEAGKLMVGCYGRQHSHHTQKTKINQGNTPSPDQLFANTSSFVTG